MILWNHWKEFCGESNPNAWIQNPSYTIPKVQCYLNNSNVGSVQDYMGLPVGLGDIVGSFNALPFRALALIWNEYFRDENLMDPININFGDATVGLATLFPYSGNKNVCPPVCKYRDYFTSALPGVQKGPSVPVIPSRYIPVAPNDAAQGMLWDVSDSIRVKVGESSSNQDLINDNGTIKLGTATTSNAIHPVNLFADMWLGGNANMWNVK